ncbi:MAG: HEAT repeat domain-containing protein [Deltaproteobacteria bacterium]|nr:HEAT repeat domain-containing protein [Deltaproteobacteria bacterium]
MGLFDIFLGKDERAEKARTKNIARATDKYKQSVDRMRALEALLDDGSDEALFGLMRRFGVTYDKSIEDEHEKEWVCEVLVKKGLAVLPAVQRYLKSADSVSWPLRVLSAITSTRAEELTVLGEILDRHEPGYERDPTKKTQIVSHLGLMKQDGVSERIVGYLEDMDEGVRFATVEALLRHKNEPVARDPLLSRFVSAEEESLRLRRRIAEGFADLGWLVQGFRGKVETLLPDNFILDREGHFKLKPGATGN